MTTCRQGILANKIKSDPALKAREQVRRRLKDFIKGKIGVKWCSLVGCNSATFKSHIESKFYNGMTWENYGTFWHIDHKRPLSSFDLTDRAQWFIASHYSNLQPLTATDNIAKSDKLIYEKAA